LRPKNDQGNNEDNNQVRNTEHRGGNFAFVCIIE
jgi:hypothetical protein